MLVPSTCQELSKRFWIEKVRLLLEYKASLRTHLDLWIPFSYAFWNSLWTLSKDNLAFSVYSFLHK